MSESERRRKYRYNRVLIETERILAPQFHDAVVFLSGAQIEMLRNVTQYLNRLETYVTEYASGYYLAPTAEDYDSILEIVADLEEVLMGNKNTIWGYTDRMKEDLYNDGPDEGTNTMDTTPVPANEVHLITDLYTMFEGEGVSGIVVSSNASGSAFILKRLNAPVDNQPDWWQGSHVLKEGDYLTAAFYGTAVDDIIQFHARGYIMQVP